ncbi:MAG: hypothetical protein V2A66_08640 [Pseudomonadota bacterium]
MKRAAFLFVLTLCAFAISGDAAAKKTSTIRATGGMNISNTGLAVDAGYDKRLDGFVPGYKVINVALFNQSLNIIGLDPEKDRWSIKLEGDGKTHPAIHDLRGQDPKAWSQVPEKARTLVAYPLVLAIGAREVVDIFVPESLDLDRFTELDIYLKSMDTKLEILVRQ